MTKLSSEKTKGLPLTGHRFIKGRLPFLREDKDGIILKLYIQPRASRNEIAGIHNGSALKIRLTTPPVDGAANSAIVEFLAGIIEMRKGQIEIISGGRSRIKQVRIKGISLKTAEDSLLKSMGG